MPAAGRAADFMHPPEKPGKRFLIPALRSRKNPLRIGSRLYPISMSDGTFSARRVFRKAPRSESSYKKKFLMVMKTAFGSTPGMPRKRKTHDPCSPPVFHFFALQLGF